MSKKEKSVDYRPLFTESLRKNKKEQIAYLKAALEDNWDMPGALLLALRTVADARGFSSFAKETGLSRESLYKTLSKNGNPKLETILKIFHAMGLKLTVEPIKNKRAS